MSFELHDYQITGAKWLAARRFGILADEMGIGKSAQSIAAADLVRAKKILVICRAVARHNWKNEFQKFSAVPRSIRIINGTLPLADYGEGDLFPREDVIICSFEGVGVVAHHLGTDNNFDLVIVDESHFVKSTDAKRSKMIFGKDGICRRTARMWCLTGTPTPNGKADELWLALFTFGAAKMAKPDFIKFFCTTKPTGYGLAVTGSKTDSATLDSWKKMVDPVLLRRRLDDTNLNLPDITYETITVEPGEVDITEHAEWIRYSLDPESRELLNKKLATEYGLLSGILENNKMSPDLLEIIKAEAGSISTIRRFNGLQKIEPVCDLIKGELESGLYQKIVIFAMHRACIKGIEARLSEFKPVVVWGGSKPERVERHIEKFQDRNSNCRVFIGQIIAAGTSINLTTATECVIVEQDFTPGNNDQAVKRLLRIGQKNNVRVRTIALDEALDRRVTEIVQKKIEDINHLFDTPVKKSVAFEDLA